MEEAYPPLGGAKSLVPRPRGRSGGGPRVGESWVSLLSARALSGGAAILSPLRLSSGGITLSAFIVSLCPGLSSAPLLPTLNLGGTLV